jgi:hypothetical protein
MGTIQGTDAGRRKQMQGRGDPEQKEHGTCDRPEKEGLIMTRSECEKIIGDCLNTIRDALNAYLPEIKDEVICSMYVSDFQDSAFILDSECLYGDMTDSDGYLLNYHRFMNNDEEGDEE